MKKIWEQHHSLIQWVVVALLVASVAIWLGADTPDAPVESDQPPVAVESASAELAPIEEIIVEPPAVASVPPAVEKLVVVEASKVEEIAEPVEQPKVAQPSLVPESAPASAPQPQPQPQPQPEPVADLSCPEWSQSAAVSRGTFTRGVDRNLRAPVDSVCSLERSEGRIYYFSDLYNQFGKRIHHLWEYNGKSMAKVALGRVKGPRWRVWSSKNLIPGWRGRWTVKVVDDQGNILHQESFEYGR